ncbi:MAG: hypothetical protein HY985_03935 [Magnetospirillum sp.]|nr:hypothetical protein [Magnetospirillum sp.]
MRFARNIPGLAGMALMVASLGACSSTCAVNHVQMQENRTANAVVFTGPFEQRDGRCVADTDGDRLRSIVDKTSGKVVHWVDTRMEWTGTGWSYWVGARDETSDRPLTMGPANRSATDSCSRMFGWGCDHQEEVGAIVPDDLLRQRAADAEGLKVRFVRKRGSDAIARFSREQVKAHLDSIDAWRLTASDIKP